MLRLRKSSEHVIFVYPRKLKRSLNASVRMGALFKIAITLVPYLFSIVGWQLIADVLSLFLYVYMLFSIKIPIWILSAIFKIQDSTQVRFHRQNRKWAVYWLSTVVMGGSSFCYFVLGKYVFGSQTADELFSVRSIGIWMLLIAGLGYLITALTEREYLMNVFGFNEDDFRRNEINFLSFVDSGHIERVKAMIVSEVGTKAYNTYKKVGLLLGLTLGFFSVLPGVLFHGGSLFIDVTIFLLMFYTLLFDPEKFSSYEDKFYVSLTNSLREPLSASGLFSFIVLCSLAGWQFVSGIESLSSLIISIILVFVSLLLLTEFFPRPLTNMTPVVGMILIQSMCVANSMPLNLVFGYSLIPVLVYFVMNLLYSFLDLQKDFDATIKTIAWAIPITITFTSCTLLITMGSNAAQLLFISLGLLLAFVLLNIFLARAHML